MSAKQLNPAYDGMTDQQVKRFKYWEFRTMAMCIFGYALFYFVRKNPRIAMPYLIPSTPARSRSGLMVLFQMSSLNSPSSAFASA